MQKNAHLYSKERTIHGLVLPRTPVFSPLTPPQIFSRERRLGVIFNKLTMPKKLLESLWKQNLYKTMLWFIYLAKLRTDLLDNRSLAILLETYKLLICYTLVFGQPLSSASAQSRSGCTDAFALSWGRRS